jgi:hypothetical protein
MAIEIRPYFHAGTYRSAWHRVVTLDCLSNRGSFSSKLGSTPGYRCKYLLLSKEREPKQEHHWALALPPPLRANSTVEGSGSRNGHHIRNSRNCTVVPSPICHDGAESIDLNHYIGDDNFDRYLAIDGPKQEQLSVQIETPPSASRLFRRET